MRKKSGIELDMSVGKGREVSLGFVFHSRDGKRTWRVYSNPRCLQVAQVIPGTLGRQDSLGSVSVHRRTVVKDPQPWECSDALGQAHLWTGMHLVP